MSFGDSGGTCNVSQCTGNYKDMHIKIYALFIVSSHCRAALLDRIVRHYDYFSLCMSSQFMVISVHQTVGIGN